MLPDENKKILVIDDEENARVGLCRLLGNEGYSVTCAGNGHEALAQLRVENFQLVISDINMPKMNGLDFLKEVQQLQPETRVIMMTAYGDVESYLEAMNLGASEYLHKPVRIKDLKSVMHKLTNQSVNQSRVEAREAGP